MCLMCMQCVPMCVHCTAFWKVISSTEDTCLASLGYHIKRLKTSAPMIPPTVVQLVHCTADNGVSPHKGSYHKMVSLSGRKTLLN